MLVVSLFDEYEYSSAFAFFHAGFFGPMHLRALHNFLAISLQYYCSQNAILAFTLLSQFRNCRAQHIDSYRHEMQRYVHDLPLQLSKHVYIFV